MCCEEAITAYQNVQPYRPFRSTRLLLQVKHEPEVSIEPAKSRP
ncbi:hypothetical protein PPUJ20066_55270 [Pseudomonas putida]|nr:hypothetical protein PPUJ20066_55270 [Pseudomonas putida]